MDNTLTKAWVLIECFTLTPDNVFALHVIMSKNIKKSFSIESKYNILLDFRRNKLTQTEICRKYDISFSTFHRWVKTESEIKEKFESNAFIPDRKRDRASKYEKVEKELYKWIATPSLNRLSLQVQKNPMKRSKTTTGTMTSLQPQLY